MNKKLVSCILILAIFIIAQLPVFAQTTKKTSYPAILITKQNKDIKRKSVSIVQEDGTLKINGRKDAKITRSLPFAAIKTAHYSYSDKPQIKEAIGAAILSGGAWFITMGFLFNKTKRHWLVLQNENEAVLLELEKDSYRRLLLEMTANGIKVEDLGDKDAK